MNHRLMLGFVPLIDAAALIAAERLGFFRTEGLTVELRREVSWATVRDKLAVGALDGAHLLAPVALACALGLGGHVAPVAAPFVLNRGGAAVTLSSRIAQRDDPAGGLRRLVARRRRQGSSPLTFAVVFPHSIHAYLLRRWLSEAGLDPLRDVLLTVAPPHRMADLLAEGVIEGFCAGEPWNAAAVLSGAGQVVERASRVWPQAPDKVLALGSAAQREPEVVFALVRALSAAGAWLAAPDNRGEVLELLAEPGHLGVAPDLLAQAFADVGLAGEAVNAPQETDAVWLVGQMSRAGQLDAGAAAAAARRTFRRDLYEAAMRPSA